MVRAAYLIRTVRLVSHIQKSEEECERIPLQSPYSYVIISNQILVPLCCRSLSRPKQLAAQASSLIAADHSLSQSLSSLYIPRTKTMKYSAIVKAFVVGTPFSIIQARRLAEVRFTCVFD
jgi:hypothetical protein